MQQSLKLVQQISIDNTLGEGVIWDPRTQNILWTDIQQSRLYLLPFGENTPQVIACPQRLGCFGLTLDPNWLICAFESGFAFFNHQTQNKIWIKEIEKEYPQTRFNDGRVDRQGRFWAGTMVEAEGQAACSEYGGLYRLDSLSKVTKVLDKINIANGLCWSPCGKTMYFADSPTRSISRYSHDPQSGEYIHPHAFASTAPTGFPDGSCVDSEGYMWNAQWGSHTVNRYSPEGEKVFTLHMPCEQPSCVAFGGPDLQHLIVTSAKHGLPQAKCHTESGNGDLYIYQTPFTGLAESICDLPLP